MAGEESQQQAPLRYMTVPEKIELGKGRGDYPAGAGRDPPGGGGRYRPMKVPDKITLEPTLPPPQPSAALSSEEGGEGDKGGMVQRVALHGGSGQSGMPPLEPTSNIQGAQVTEAVVGGQAAPGLVDLERRVRTLEHQVQRLTDTVVNSRPAATSSGSSQGNGFWYVLTFTGWMMVPLVVVFMYHLKKNL